MAEVVAELVQRRAEKHCDVVALKCHTVRLNVHNVAVVAHKINDFGLLVVDIRVRQIVRVGVVEIVDVDALEPLPTRLSEQRHVVLIRVAVELSDDIGHKRAVGRRDDDDVLLALDERAAQDVAARVVVILVVAHLVEVVVLD